MPSYPDAPRLDIVDDMHGFAVHDPYRWLEDTADPQTETWSAAQDRLVDAARDGWATREDVRATLAKLHDIGEVGAPQWRGRREFAVRREPGQEHPVLIVKEPSGATRVLIDPMAVDPTGTTTLDFWKPSQEGDLLAYGLSEGGTEESVVRVLDVATGAIVDGPIDRARFTPIAWLPGGKTFFYVRHLPSDSEFGEDARFYRRIYRHEVGADLSTDVLIFGADAPRATYLDIAASRDGRWLAITGSRGTDPRNDMWFVDISDGSIGDVIPVQVGEDARIWPEFGGDGTCYALTNRGAPRWRIVAVDPAKPDIAEWREIVVENETAVIVDYHVFADAGLVTVVRRRHAVCEVVVHDLATGAELRRISLPGIGSITDLTAGDGDEAGTDFWVTYTDFATPPQVLRVDAATAEVSVWASPSGSPEIEVTSRQITYKSYDGTTIRMFVLEPATSSASGPRPTILNGYGGFNISSTPEYRPLILAWLAHGGAWAVASLRGGSEEGESWHHDGMRENKQHVFDDFAAASDWLVENGITTREQLGIFGGSNGGLLVGAALTQHPEKYAAVVCSAPLLDMLRYELFGLGETWNGEYGTVADPTEFGWLRAYSPYHNVHDGADYPAVLFTIFEGDSRVDTMHARKLCASLQHATSGERPILIRREVNVGHASRSVSRAVALATDEVAFFAAQLGLPA